jgi:hypothetical protein
MSSIEEKLKQELQIISNKIKDLESEKKKIKAALDAVRGFSDSFDAPVKRQSSDMTFKDKIEIALSEKFTEGAISNDILDYCNERWPEYPIKRSSLSPQLSRLKVDGVIDLVDKKWVLKEKPSEASTSEGLNLDLGAV